MSEQQNPDQNPFEQLEAAGFPIPAFEALTPEQQQALTDGPGRVEQPVTDTLTDFNDFEEFNTKGDATHRTLRDNFYVHFTKELTRAKQVPQLVEQGICTDEADALDLLGDTVVSIPAMQRFEILFPDLKSDITSSLAAIAEEDGYTVQPDKLDADQATLQKLFVAYKLVRQLVDQRDDPKVESDYLTY